MDVPVNGFQHEASLLFAQINRDSMLEHLTFTSLPFLVKLIVTSVQKRQPTLSLLHDVDFDLSATVLRLCVEANQDNLSMSVFKRYYELQCLHLIRFMLANVTRFFDGGMMGKPDTTMIYYQTLKQKWNLETKLPRIVFNILDRFAQSGMSRRNPYLLPSVQQILVMYTRDFCAEARRNVIVTMCNSGFLNGMVFMFMSRRFRPKKSCCALL